MTRVALLFLFASLAFGQTNPWKRQGTVISPRRSGDSVAMDTTLPSGEKGTTAINGFTSWSTGRPLLRDWQARIGKLTGMLGGNPTVLMVGDSWTNNGLIHKPLQFALQQTFGHGGAGYVAFDSLAAVPPGVTLTSAGTWTDAADSPSAGIDGNRTTSLDAATPGSKVLTGQGQFIIHYLKQPDGGSFRWKINSGSWTTVDTANATAALGTVDTGVSTALNVLTVEVVTAGTAGVTLFGADVRLATGARVHRAGHSGATGATFTAITPAIWQAEITALDPSVVIVLLGVNEASVGTAAATYAANLGTMYDSIKTAVPLADVLFVTPADIGAVTTYPMSTYVEAMRGVALSKNAGFIDAYKLLGPYADGNSRGIYTNTTHVNAGGGAAIASAIEGYLSLGVKARWGTNIGFGYGALTSLTTGRENVAIGKGAFDHATTGAQSVAIGSDALTAVTTGASHTAIGWSALKAITTTSGGTAVGYNALAAATGATNTAVGYRAGVTGTAANQVTTGANNTFLGADAGPGSSTQQNYMTVIGAGATGACDNCVVLGRATDVTIMRPPTSCTGLAAGTLWNDTGTLKICP